MFHAVFLLASLSSFDGRRRADEQAQRALDRFRGRFDE